MFNSESDLESYEKRRKEFLECTARLDRLEYLRKKNAEDEEKFCLLLNYEISQLLFSHFPELREQINEIKYLIEKDILVSGKEIFSSIFIFIYKDERFYEKLWESDAALIKERVKILTDDEIEKESIKSAKKLRKRHSIDNMSEYDFEWNVKNFITTYKNERHFKTFMHKLYKTLKKCAVEIIAEIINFEPDELIKLDACLFIEAHNCYEKLMNLLNGKLNNPFPYPEYKNTD